MTLSNVSSTSHVLKLARLAAEKSQKYDWVATRTTTTEAFDGLVAVGSRGFLTSLSYLVSLRSVCIALNGERGLGHSSDNEQNPRRSRAGYLHPLDRK
jgi:hypothetical protein